MQRLANYVEAIHYSGVVPEHAGPRPFNNGNAKDPPLLRPRGVNRILLFPGAFNPPHRGHLDLLSFAYLNAGADLNIMAAIIIPTDDSRLVLKTSEDENPLVLSKEKRVSLWKGNGIPVDWAWVYDRSEASWHDFRQQLENAVKGDGIELKFIFLGGPDYVGYKALYDPGSWACTDVITSDISRPVDFRYPYSMRQLPGCSPWTDVRYSHQKLEHQIRGKMRGQSQKATAKAIAQAHAAVRAVSVCREHRQPRGYIRFVPCNVETRTKLAPSSTEIRRAIAASCPEKLEEELAAMALNPGMLVEYLRKST